MKVAIRDQQRRPILHAEPLSRALRTITVELGVAAGSVGYAFVDDNRMVQYHARFMDKPYTTDVLSFPNEVDAMFGSVPDGDDAYWGDVIVCTDQAARQAAEMTIPYRFELVVLCVHGALHLLGYDHTRDRGEMERLEQRLRPLCAREAFR